MTNLTAHRCQNPPVADAAARQEVAATGLQNRSGDRRRFGAVAHRAGRRSSRAQCGLRRQVRRISTPDMSPVSHDRGTEHPDRQTAAKALRSVSLHSVPSRSFQPPGGDRIIPVCQSLARWDVCSVGDSTVAAFGFGRSKAAAQRPLRRKAKAERPLFPSCLQQQRTPNYDSN